MQVVVHALEAYAFVKHVLAHLADGEVHPDEWESIVVDLARSAPGLGYRTTEWREVLSEAEGRYFMLLDKGDEAVIDEFREAVHVLYRATEGNLASLKALRDELQILAEADGTVIEQERDLIEEVERVWRDKIRSR